MSSFLLISIIDKAFIEYRQIDFEDARWAALLPVGDS